MRKFKVSKNQRAILCLIMNDISKMTPIAVVLSILLLVEYTIFNFFISVLNITGSEVEADMIIVTLITFLAIILAVFALIVIVNSITGDLSEGKVKIVKYITDAVLLMFLIELAYIVLRLIMSD